MKRIQLISLVMTVLVFLPALCMAADCSSMDLCMEEAVRTASDSTTIGELKKHCMECVKAYPAKTAASTDESQPAQDAEAIPSPIDARLENEQQTGQDWFVLTPHRPNYIMPVVYNTSPNADVYGNVLGEDDLDNVEIKFQISVKYQLFDDIFKDNGDLYIAYTNQSYWQAYNKDYSSPFRDTNHEPEAWLQFDTDWELFRGIKSKVIQVGAWHQSNGRAEPLSRSWNRLYLNLIFEKGNLVFGIKPWYRIPEDDDEDDNPDIEKYMGYGELGAAYKWDAHTFSLKFRNNLRSSENKGAIELGWSFPLHRKLKGYVQYFNGYGQSILDYNDCANTIGVGLALSDIL